MYTFHIKGIAQLHLLVLVCYILHYQSTLQRLDSKGPFNIFKMWPSAWVSLSLWLTWDKNSYGISYFIADWEHWLGDWEHLEPDAEATYTLSIFFVVMMIDPYVRLLSHLTSPNICGICLQFSDWVGFEMNISYLYIPRVETLSPGLEVLPSHA